MQGTKSSISNAKSPPKEEDLDLDVERKENQFLWRNMIETTENFLSGKQALLSVLGLSKTQLLEKTQ